MASSQFLKPVRGPGWSIFRGLEKMGVPTLAFMKWAGRVPVTRSAMPPVHPITARSEEGQHRMEGVEWWGLIRGSIGVEGKRIIITESEGKRTSVVKWGNGGIWGWGTLSEDTLGPGGLYRGLVVEGGYRGTAYSEANTLAVSDEYWDLLDRIREEMAGALAVVPFPTVCLGAYLSDELPGAFLLNGGVGRFCWGGAGPRDIPDSNRQQVELWYRERGNYLHHADLRGDTMMWDGRGLESTLPKLVELWGNPPKGGWTPSRWWIKSKDWVRSEENVAIGRTRGAGPEVLWWRGELKWNPEGPLWEWHPVALPAIGSARVNHDAEGERILAVNPWLLEGGKQEKRGVRVDLGRTVMPVTVLDVPVYTWRGMARCVFMRKVWSMALGGRNEENCLPMFRELVGSISKLVMVPTAAAVNTLRLLFPSETQAAIKTVTARGRRMRYLREPWGSAFTDPNEPIPMTASGERPRERQINAGRKALAMPEMTIPKWDTDGWEEVVWGVCWKDAPPDEFTTPIPGYVRGLTRERVLKTLGITGGVGKGVVEGLREIKEMREGEDEEGFNLIPGYIMCPELGKIQGVKWLTRIEETWLPLATNQRWGEYQLDAAGVGAYVGPIDAIGEEGRFDRAYEETVSGDPESGGGEPSEDVNQEGGLLM